VGLLIGLVWAFIVQLYRATFLQWTTWHRADSWRHFSGGLHITINHRLIDQQRSSGISRLHLNMMCLEWWQSVCTESTDWKSKKTWWEWRKLTYTVHYKLGYRRFSGIFVALELCLGWNNTSIMSCSLPKLASYKSKNIIWDWMVDFSCTRTSIRGQEIPGGASCS